MEKFLRAFLILALLGSLVGVWAFGLNQVVRLVDNVHATNERNAIAECVVQGAPHAVVADGEIYCYMTWNGTEQMISLEELKKIRKKNGGG